MILQGVEFSIYVLILAWALQQCSATALPVIAFFCIFLVLNSLLMLCYAFNLLMAFDRLLLKGLLTLLTYLLTIILVNFFIFLKIRGKYNWYFIPMVNIMHKYRILS